MRNGSIDRPNLRVRGTKDQAPTSDAEAIQRVAVVVGVVTQPVIAATAVVAVGLLGRTRVKGWLVVLIGVAGMVWSLSRGWGIQYTALYREAFASILLGRESFLSTAASSWSSWLLGQLPFGVSVGLIVAGVVLWWRSRYVASWREPEEAKPLKSTAIERRKTRQSKTAVKGKAAADLSTLMIPMGVDDRGQTVEIPASALRMHGVIAGPSGYGKTESLLRMIHGLTVAPAAVGLRLPCVFIDMKADGEVVHIMRRFAEMTGRRFWLVENTAVPGTDRYNCLVNGTPDQTRAKLIEAEANSADGGFSEPHYRRMGERFLLIAARAHADLVATGRTCPGENRPWQADLGDLVRLLDLHQLTQHMEQYSPPVARDVARYVAEAEQAKIGPDLYGIRTRYALMVESAAGDVLEYSPTGLVLHDAISNGDLVLFSLDAGTDPATARALGNLALQDLIFTFAQLQSEAWGKTGGFCPVFIDEFQALGGSLVANLYARSRSAGGAILLATQDLDGDLAAVSDQFASAVLTNANVMVLHRQKGAAASARAEALGTRQSWSETLQVQDDWDVLGGQQMASGVGSLREVDKFIIHPNQFKQLPQGVAYVLVEHPKQLMVKCHINRLLRDDVTPSEPPKKERGGDDGTASWAEAVNYRETPLDPPAPDAAPLMIDTLGPTATVPPAGSDRGPVDEDDHPGPLTEPEDYEEW